MHLFLSPHRRAGMPLWSEPFSPRHLPYGWPLYLAYINAYSAGLVAISAHSSGAPSKFSWRRKGDASEGLTLTTLGWKFKFEAAALESQYGVQPLKSMSQLFITVMESNIDLDYIVNK